MWGSRWTEHSEADAKARTYTIVGAYPASTCDQLVHADNVKPPMGLKIVEKIDPEGDIFLSHTEKKY